MSSLYYIVLFCLLAIGWELFMWSFCGVLVELLLSLSAFLGRNYRLHKKEEKKSTYSRNFKNAAIDKPNVGDFSRVLENVAQSRFVAAFSKNTNIGLSL